MRLILGDLLSPVDDRGPSNDTVVLSVSEQRGVLPQSSLFKKRIALDDLSKYKVVHPGDVVYNPFLLWNRAVGVSFQEGLGCVSPAYQVLRPRDPRLARLLHYYLRSPNFTAKVDAIARGTATRRRVAPLQEVLRLAVELPDTGDAVRAAEALEVLDRKIEHSTRLKQLLDESWLTKVESCFERHAQGTVRLSHLAAFVNGRAFTKNASGTGRIVIRIAELNAGPGPTTVQNDIEVPEQHLAREGDLLFAWSGSLTVQRWFRSEAIINQHIFKVIPTTGIPLWLVHGHLVRLLEQFRGIAADKATTMGHIQRRHLDVEVPRLDEDGIRSLDSICSPLWRRALAAEQEIVALEAAREGLLPLLLAGTVRVSQTEGRRGDEP